MRWFVNNFPWFIAITLGFAISFELWNEIVKYILEKL